MPRSFSIVAGVIVAVSWTACVGDDPTTGGSAGPATGDRLGACFDDGKCKEGLECRLPERICLTPGEPVPPDAGVDASTGDASGSDGGDAATDAKGDGGTCKIQSDTSPGIFCGPPGKRCAAGAEGCCLQADGNSMCTPPTQCPAAGGSYFACEGTSSCGSPNLRCCLTEGSPGPATACGDSIQATGTTCMQTCPSTLRIVCNVDGDCPSNKCVPTEIWLQPNNASTRRTWGICAK